MFIDMAKITVSAGRGGDGMVGWRREKFEPAGGPAGGNGGRGASIILKTSNNIHTLMDFRYKRVYKGKNGENGKGNNQYGADAEDIVLKVPVGTLVKDAETDTVIVDMKDEDMEYTIVEGGRGGRGNTKFKSSTRQAPKFAERGREGETKEIVLELKLLADVGLIGFPNVGKSSLLSIVSAAKPKIDNYHFTTLSPNLGVVRIDYEESFVIADIPGLIEGAAEGLGLGHEFLKHVERTKVLIHVLDISGIEGRDPVEDYYLINKELSEYNEELAEKPQIIYANKMDLPGAEENLKRLKEELEGTDLKIFSGSVVKNDNLDSLMKYTWQVVERSDSKYDTFDDEYVPPKTREFVELSVIKEDGVYIVIGDEIERLISTLNTDDHESLRYFQNQMVERGVMDMLRDAGIQEGDTVVVGHQEFEYMP